MKIIQCKFEYWKRISEHTSLGFVYLLESIIIAFQYLGYSIFTKSCANTFCPRSLLALIVKLLLAMYQPIVTINYDQTFSHIFISETCCKLSLARGGLLFLRPKASWKVTLDAVYWLFQITQQIYKKGGGENSTKIGFVLVQFYTLFYGALIRVKYVKRKQKMLSRTW